MINTRDMDDFFDFEGAGILEGASVFNNVMPQHSSSGGFDIDMILAEAANDQVFNNNSQQFGFDFLPSTDNPMGYGEAFNDHLRWVPAVERSTKACAQCQQNGFACTLMRNVSSESSGACTSCIALSQPCSLLHQVAVQKPPTDTLVSTFTAQDHEMVDSAAIDMQISRSTGSTSPAVRESSHENGEESSKAPGVRFSRETVLLLRKWLQIHHIHPYPTEEEKEELKRKTGLTKVQITNWLANARRRGQIKPPRMTSPRPDSRSQPISIAAETARPFEKLPLERWKNSSPESEPASATAIAKAVQRSPNLSSYQTSPDSYPPSEGSAHSVAHESSASSRNTTRSSLNSVGSALSHRSHGSFGSFGKSGRRRRRHTAKKAPNNVNGPIRQYQCTFCTESFKTKHDWQRHEKSLHLSLERWVCACNKSKSLQKCVFCGAANPTDKHYESHNHATCSERPLVERTFYRKDHLRQHLRLVHDCQFLASTMDAWKIAAPEVRSRCGFCGIIMDTWSARVDHLAEHFKGGKTMEEWKGGWGFESSVMEMVENSMPPYLIHSRRLASLYAKDPTPLGSLKMTSYDTLKSGLLNFANQEASVGRQLTDDELRNEACHLLLNTSGNGDQSSGGGMISWFNDMLVCTNDTMSLEELRRNSTKTQAQDSPTKQAAVVDIDDTHAVEKYCELERRLADYVNHQKGLGLTPTDKELKAAGCRIVLDYDRMYSIIHSATAATWFCNQIMASDNWLPNFRKRMGLPPKVQMSNPDSESNSNDQVDDGIQTSVRLERELASFTKGQLSLGIIPSDSDLQRQARMIIYEVDDGFFQTLADDLQWLTRFKNAHGIRYFHSLTDPAPQLPQSFQNSGTKPLYTLQDAKCYRRLELELSRFVASCVSANAPNPHIPSDDEIRRQARWVLYNDDSPWNQTAVDNAEWLLRFKRSNGLAPLEGKAMPVRHEAMAEEYMCFGGVGLTPPSVPDEELVPLSPIHDLATQAAIDEETRVVNRKTNYGGPPTTASTTSGSVTRTRATASRLRVPKQRISTVFCNWELEAGLATFAVSKGRILSDEELRQKAREIVGRNDTSADEEALLLRFREVYGLSVMRNSGAGSSTGSEIVVKTDSRGCRGGGTGKEIEAEGVDSVALSFEGRIDPALLGCGVGISGDMVMDD